VPAAYPILLEVSDKSILIVGGGQVALRKAIKLIEAGAARITVLAPEFAGGFPAKVRKITGSYTPDQLAGADLVFAATNSPRVNAAIVEEARKRHVWVSRADGDEDHGDFTAAAALQEGGVTVAVWAQSPALSAAIRDGLHNRWDARWTAMAEAMRILRPIVMNSGLSPDRRRELFRELATDAAMDELATDGIDALRDWITKKTKELSTKDTKEHEEES
jgi:precorrin-2 dehydrogenase / sirohydrochlorin ferrochelatase